MKVPFSLQDYPLCKQLEHLVYHPADPLYNGFILTGDSIGRKVALRRLQAALAERYPAREVLYYTAAQLTAFIQSSPAVFLQRFYQLHPDLLCVLAEDVSVADLNACGQDKLALFFKSLIRHRIQVAVSTEISARMGDKYAPYLTGELWSWFNSGKDYRLPHGKILSLERVDALSLTEDAKQCQLFSFFRARKYPPAGLPKGVLCREPARSYSRSMNAKISLIGRGVFYESCQLFPRAVCPVCRAAEMVLYECSTACRPARYCLKFWCPCCQERFATAHMPGYFSEVQKYAAARLNRVRGPGGTAAGVGYFERAF